MKTLMFEYMDYETVFQVGSHYFARNFAKDNHNVNWVTNPKSYLYNSTETFLDREVEKNIKLLTPKVLFPYCKYPILNSKVWANNYLSFLTSDLSDRWNDKSIDLLWMTNVKMYKMSESINYKTMVHRMADDFSGFRGAYKNMQYLQDQVVRKSDVVFVTAKNLVDKAYKHNKQVFYLPNGVNVERFNDETIKIPEEYNHINMPKVIYVGAMEDWFDFELIKESARKNKDLAFILIGEINESLKKVFSENSNVYLLGKKKHNEIPSYLKYADIGIMPFLNNKLTNSIHPLKLYEYFAAGLPVISRKLDEVSEMNSPAYLYDSNDEFNSLIKEVQNNKKETETLLDYANNNTWNSRYATVKQIIEDLNR